jgi:DNA-binding transcriptional ArsR family regulator
MLNTGAAVAEHDLEQLTSLFRLLSDKTRLNILLALAQGERNVTNLCDELRLPQPTVSHHLGLLRINNMIGNRRKGKQVFYALTGAVNNTEAGSLDLGVENFTIRVSSKQM